MIFDGDADPIASASGLEWNAANGDLDQDALQSMVVQPFSRRA